MAKDNWKRLAEGWDDDDFKSPVDRACDFLIRNSVINEGDVDINFREALEGGLDNATVGGCIKFLMEHCDREGDSTLRYETTDGPGGDIVAWSVCAPSRELVMTFHRFFQGRTSQLALEEAVTSSDEDTRSVIRRSVFLGNDSEGAWGTIPGGSISVLMDLASGKETITSTRREQGISSAGFLNAIEELISHLGPLDHRGDSRDTVELLKIVATERGAVLSRAEEIKENCELSPEGARDASNRANDNVSPGGMAADLWKHRRKLLPILALLAAGGIGGLYLHFSGEAKEKRLLEEVAAAAAEDQRVRTVAAEALCADAVPGELTWVGSGEEPVLDRDGLYRVEAFGSTSERLVIGGENKLMRGGWTGATVDILIPGSCFDDQILKVFLDAAPVCPDSLRVVASDGKVLQYRVEPTEEEVDDTRYKIPDGLVSFEVDSGRSVAVPFLAFGSGRERGEILRARVGIEGDVLYVGGGFKAHVEKVAAALSPEPLFVGVDLEESDEGRMSAEAFLAGLEEL
jgi:hypothetical protein